MRFPEYFKNKGKPVISFEVFPPKTDAGMRTLQRRHLPELVKLNPSYLTVTYGAMGTTQDKTLEIATFIKREFDVEAGCHFTCVGASKSEIDRIIANMRDAGIRNLICLRGDPPQGTDKFVPPKDGFAHANELVTHIRATEPKDDRFGIAVAGYPEKHLEAPDLDTDIANLKRKVDSGADSVITQLFFDNAPFYSFVEKARAAGIEVPIVPGIMPILSAQQIQRITSMCGSTIPPDLESKLNAALDDDEKALQIGVDQCIAQATELLERGVPGIHFYVLNRHVHIREIMEALPV